MTKKITFVSVLLAVLTVGSVLYALDYQVTGLSFSGVMASASDSDTLHLHGQEGVNPTICLMHAPNVDFDFAVSNNGVEVGRNIAVGPRTCSTVHTPGTVTIRVWSASGSGAYQVSIQP